MKNVMFWTHTILGLALGIIIAVVGFSGAALSFQNEILALLNPKSVYVEANDKKLDTNALLSTLQTKFESNINSITLSSDEGKAAKVNVASNESTRGKNYYVNQYTSEILPQLEGEGFFNLMFKLHRWMGGDAQSIGKQIVAIGTVAMILLCISGFYMYFPLIKNSFINSLKIDFKKNGRAFLYKLHAALGVWTLIFILLMSLTGLFWSYNWYRSGLFWIAGVESGGMKHGNGGAVAQSVIEGYDFDKAIAKFKEVVKDDYSSFTMSLPKSNSAQIGFSYFTKNPAHSRASNQLTLNASTLEVVKEAKYADKKLGEKFIGSIYPLHSGDFFGIIGVFIYCVSSLAAVLFAVTGYMLYFKRSFKTKK